MKYLILTIIPLFLIISISSIPQAQTPDSSDSELFRVVKEIDELYRSTSSHGTIEMQIVTPHWERALEMEMWSRGMEMTLVRIHSPAKEAGVGTLRIGNEMWNFLPKTNKVIKIPPSMMMSSWMGSDFTNDDLVKEYTFVDDYIFLKADAERSDDSLIYIKCIPKKDRPIVWGHVLIAVREQDTIPVWQKYFDEHNKLIRIAYYTDIKTFSGRLIPATVEMVPQDEEGKTVVRYKDLQFEVKLDDNIFSLRNLRTPQ